MIDGELALLALRARMVAAVVATTGSTTLSATSTGYARSSGSFLADGFRAGYEITQVTGFSVAGNNQATTSQGRVITEVTALAITCSGCSTDASASGRTIIVGVPFQRAYDDIKLAPVVGYPYIREDFAPATTAVRTIPVRTGYAEDTGLYVITWFGIAGKGGIRRCADAVLERFTPGTTFALSDGTGLRIPSEQGPYAGQVTPVGDGNWAFCQITVPYIGESINAVAA